MVSTILKKRRYVGLAILTAVTLLIPGSCAYLSGNFRVVEPGAFYRSGQMSTARLEKVLTEYGIKTVVCLRGASEETWFTAEADACQRHGAAFYNLPWTKSRIPEPDSLAALLELYQRAEGPMLVHCQGGTHRTGVATATYLLMQGADVPKAREAFGPFFDEAPIGQLLDLYEGSALPFNQWVDEAYPPLYDTWLETNEKSEAE